jgi:DNA adenine methylase
VRRLSPAGRVARFIYLNKTCFNGLYRVNSSGRFNVPYGRIPHARVRDEPVLRRVSAALAEVELCTGDFAQSCLSAKRGDLVYFDPPYLTETRGRALRYRKTVFGLEEHERLAELVLALAAKGCMVMVSNADLPAVRKMYRGLTIERLEVSRPINANARGRSGFTELFIHNLGKEGRGRLAAQAMVKEVRRSSRPVADGAQATRIR